MSTRHMKRLGAFLLVLTLAFVPVFAGGQAESAKEGPEYIFKAAGSGPAGSEIADAQYGIFKRKVEEYSNGRIRVDLYLGNALGGERETMEMLMQGTLEISLSSDSTYSLFEPKWAIMDLPYFVSTREEAWRFLDGEGGKELGELMLGKGIRILGYEENSIRQISNRKREIRTPSDLKGLKIRITETPTQVDWYKSVGAIPTPLPLPEMVPALQQGVVDGQDNGMLNMSYMNVEEFQKYYTDTNHDYSSIPIAINEALWQKLPSDLQVALQRAATESVEESRNKVLELEGKAIENLQKRGMQITFLTAQERAAFEATAKPIWQKYATEFGEDFMDWAFAQVGKSWR